MTAEQIYAAIDGDYNGASLRLRKHALVIRLLKLFPSDPSMNELRSAVEEQDPQKAFRAVHTLKGVALNLGFTRLGSVASDLTELLRSGAFTPGWEAAYEAVCSEYEKTAAALGNLEE